MPSFRDPRTKEDFLDRLMMADFDGDIRSLGRERAQIERISPFAVRLTFPFSGTVFDLEVHRPREANMAAKGARSFAPSNVTRRERIEDLWEGEQRSNPPEMPPDRQERGRSGRRRSA